MAEPRNLLLQNPDAVPPTPSQTFEELTLATVLNSGNDADGLTISGLGDPADPQDAATQAYVDASHMFVVASVDPGAIGAYRIWVDLHATGGGTESRWKRRNVTDDGWETPFLVVKADGTITVTGNDTEPLMLSNGASLVAIDPADDTLTLHTPTADIAMQTDGGLSLSGSYVNANGIAIVSGGELSGVPTVEPATPGVLWNDAGVAKFTT